MLLLEIILIVFGLAAVVFSYKMSDYGNSGGENQMENEGGEKQKEMFLTQEKKEEFERELEEKREEAIQMASDELSRLSNDKIMGMDEYSSQVLDKIAKNHEEVVFLYNMLGEKEEEIKRLVHHVDTVKAQMHDEAAGEYQKMAQVLKLLEKKKAKLEQSIHEQERMTERVGASSHKRKELNAAYDKEVKAIEEAEEKEQPQYFPKADRAEKEKDTARGNHNDEILNLYKQGHSVLEISRMLSLGQGEVKLVIDLHENG